MKSDDERSALPQSIRHKRILDLAEERPDASVDELASMVSSATPDLVEHVFETYGDPASDGETSTDSTGLTDQTDSTDPAIGQPSGGGPTDSGHPSTDGTATPDGGSTLERSDGRVGDSEDDRNESADSDRYPSPDDLSDKQRAVLTSVAMHPEATQQEIADRLEVSRATVCNRVNSIEGFDWSDRTSFVEAVFDEPPTADHGGVGGGSSELTTAESDGTATTDPPSASVGREAAEQTTDFEPLLDRLEACVTDLESRVAALEASRDRATNGDSAFTDPELVHKIVHACLNDDNVSEAEELRILKELLT